MMAALATKPALSAPFCWAERVPEHLHETICGAVRAAEFCARDMEAQKCDLHYFEVWGFGVYIEVRKDAYGEPVWGHWECSVSDLSDKDEAYPTDFDIRVTARWEKKR